MTLLLLLKPTHSSPAVPDNPSVGGGGDFVNFRDSFGQNPFTDPFAKSPFHVKQPRGER